MPAECPNCRGQIPRLRVFFTHIGGRFRCSACGSILGIDARRRLLAMIPWAAALFFLIRVVRLTSFGYAFALPILIVACLVNFFLFDRVVVHERTGFRCRECGYDLQGQTEPRCPECGSPFDPAGLSAYKSRPDDRPVARLSKSGFVMLLVVIGLAVFLALGVLYTRYGRTKATPKPAAVLKIEKTAAPSP